MTRVFKYTKLAIIALITIFFAAFSSVNTQIIYLQFPFTDTVLEVKQFIVIFASTLLGMLIIYFYFQAKNIRSFSNIKKLEKQNKTLQIEIEGLRAEAKFTNNPENNLNKNNLIIYENSAKYLNEKI